MKSFLTNKNQNNSGILLLGPIGFRPVEPMTLSRILREEHPDRIQRWFNDGSKTGSVRSNQRTGDTKEKCWCRCANVSLCSGAELCFFHASARWQRGTWTGNTYEGLSNLPEKMELENVRANFRSAFAKFQYAGSLHCSLYCLPVGVLTWDFQ